MFRQITSLPPVQKKFRQPEPLKKVQEFVLIVQITDRQQTGMMIINITYFSWYDSHFWGLAKRGEPSEQKCNTSVWSEAQTKVKLKILIPVCIAGRAQANVQLNILIPMHSRPLLRGVGHVLHNISLFADWLKGSSADNSRIIKNCHCYCWSLYKLSYLMSTICPKKDQQKKREH